MSALADELLEHTDEIVQRWCDRWAATGEPKDGLSEQSLVDHVPEQLRFIAEQLKKNGRAAVPAQMWEGAERMEPEARVEQDVPIREVVREYGLLVDTVREWLEERAIEITFGEYSYFYRAIFELTAESVRRYVEHESELVARERKEYLASVAHQMRTPLSALTLQVQLLELGATIDEATLSRLRRNVRRLELLVGGVMRTERFAPDELPVQPKRIQLERFVQRVVDDHAALAEAKGIRVEHEADPSIEASLDESLCLDAIGNLVDNAIKHTDEGSVRLVAGADEERVTIEVIDTGSGISEERQRDLFEPVRPDQHGGAGLGLTIACHAIEAQGGRIEVESAVGEGSTFRVVLPREVPEREPRAE